jgi:hypothetical protein
MKKKNKTPPQRHSLDLNTGEASQPPPSTCESLAAGFARLVSGGGGIYESPLGVCNLGISAGDRFAMPYLDCGSEPVVSAIKVSSPPHRKCAWDTHVRLPNWMTALKLPWQDLAGRQPIHLPAITLSFQRRFFASAPERHSVLALGAVWGAAYGMLEEVRHRTEQN